MTSSDVYPTRGTFISLLFCTENSNVFVLDTWPVQVSLTPGEPALTQRQLALLHSFATCHVKKAGAYSPIIPFVECEQCQDRL